MSNADRHRSTLGTCHDQWLADRYKRQDERDRRMMADFRAALRATEIRLSLLFIGGFGAVIGVVIART